MPKSRLFFHCLSSIVGIFLFWPHFLSECRRTSASCHWSWGHNDRRAAERAILHFLYVVLRQEFSNHGFNLGFQYEWRCMLPLGNWSSNGIDVYMHLCILQLAHSVDTPGYGSLSCCLSVSSSVMCAMFAGSGHMITVVYRVSVVERPSASETPLPVPCCILFFFWYLIYLFCAVMSIPEMHSVRMLYSTCCAHAVCIRIAPFMYACIGSVCGGCASRHWFNAKMVFHSYFILMFLCVYSLHLVWYVMLHCSVGYIYDRMLLFWAVSVRFSLQVAVWFIVLHVISC